jgi:DNA repair exonuclease SbcCD nuclease subunit
MSSWEAIEDRTYLDSISVTVSEAVHHDDEKLDWRLTVEDRSGKQFELEIWTKHNPLTEWEEGAEYEIRNGYGQTWDDSQKKKLHSSEEWSAERVDSSPERIQILALGDTHVGYRHRSLSDKPRWARHVDNRETLSKSLERARALDVDIVLYVGDIFDDHPSQGDIKHVIDEIQRTRDAGISVGYLLGNHDPDAGIDALDNCSALHIGDISVKLTLSLERGQHGVRVSGVDYTAGQYSGSLTDVVPHSGPGASIIAFHDTPYPVIDEDGTERYRNDSNALDVRDFLNSADDPIDLLVTGHLHVANKLCVEGYDVPVLVTGPTAKVSSYEEENRPSVWLLTVNSDNISIDRQPL